MLEKKILHLENSLVFHYSGPLVIIITKKGQFYKFLKLETRPVGRLSLTLDKILK